MSFLIGADPEFFLEMEGKFISAINKVGGSKDHPEPIGNGCAVQEDNVAVEFCIPPSDNAKAFYNSIMYSLSQIKERIPEFTFSKVASAEFDDNELAHPRAMEFGCEPDFNAWTGRKNPRPHAPNHKLRSAGGHVHVGDVTDLNKRQLIQAMDLFHGVPSVKLDPDTVRRKLYGKAGAFRPKTYGVEYRTLSNFWIWDKGLVDWVYHQTSRAVDFVRSGNVLSKEDGTLIQDAINKGNLEAYHYLQHRYGAF